MKLICFAKSIVTLISVGKYFMRSCCMPEKKVQRKQHGRMVLYNIVGKSSYEAIPTNSVKIRNVSLVKETLESS